MLSKKYSRIIKLHLFSGKCIDHYACRKSKEIEERNPQADNLSEKKVDSSDKESCCRGLTDGTCFISYKHGEEVNLSTILKYCKWCSCCNSVVGKACHSSCEAHYKEAPCGKCRVHEVLTYSAEHLLYYNYRKAAAKYRHPDWKLRRQIERQEKSCNSCTEVSYCQLLLEEVF